MPLAVCCSFRCLSYLSMPLTNRRYYLDSRIKNGRRALLVNWLQLSTNSSIPSRTIVRNVDIPHLPCCELTKRTVRWDPDREDRIFFVQSAALYSTIYHLQMLLHRPFILASDRRAMLCMHSLALCTSAARLCSHVAGVQARRSVLIDIPHQVRLLFFPMTFTRLRDSRYQHLSPVLFCFLIFGVASARDLLQIHKRTWNVFVSAWIFLN